MTFLGSLAAWFLEKPTFSVVSSRIHVTVFNNTVCLSLI